MSDLLFKPMICPVCGEFYFSELQEGDDVNELFCHQCGWKYDYSQAIDCDLHQGRNELSVNECKKEYSKKIADNPEYVFLDEENVPTPHECPVCHKSIFEDESSFDICAFCGWVDDSIMEKEPNNWAGTANDLCLNDFIIRYKKLVEQKPDYKYSKDKFLK